MATLKDIAKEAGVSIMTVSRVINGHYSKVSAENIRRIQKIIEQCGYVPNLSARSPSSKYSRIIAMVLPGHGRSLENPYNSALAGNIIEYAQCRGYYVMVHFTDDYDEMAKRLRTWRVDGAIFLGTYDRNLQLLQQLGETPLVFVDNYATAHPFNNVGIDDYKGGALAARHFLEMGHRTFAFVAPALKWSTVIRRRLAGFSDTLAQVGHTLAPEHIIDTDETPDPAAAICSLAQPVTAVLATADMLAVRLIDTLRARGLRVPEDYSFIGFDDLPIGRYITPRLTTVWQDIDQKAALASRMLFERIEHRDTPVENVSLDVRLIERESVARLPGASRPA